MVYVVLVKRNVSETKHEDTPLDTAFQERVILPARDILQYRKRVLMICGSGVGKGMWKGRCISR